MVWQLHLDFVVFIHIYMCTIDHHHLIVVSNMRKEFWVKPHTCVGYTEIFLHIILTVLSYIHTLYYNFLPYNGGLFSGTI